MVGWRPVHYELSKDYDVIAIDLPGFGHSPALPALASSAAPAGPGPGATVVEAVDPYADPYARDSRTRSLTGDPSPLVMPPSGEWSGQAARSASRD